MDHEDRPSDYLGNRTQSILHSHQWTQSLQCPYRILEPIILHNERHQKLVCSHSRTFPSGHNSKKSRDFQYLNIPHIMLLDVQLEISDAQTTNGMGNHSATNNSNGLLSSSPLRSIGWFSTKSRTANGCAKPRGPRPSALRIARVTWSSPRNWINLASVDYPFGVA